MKVPQMQSSTQIAAARAAAPPSTDPMDVLGTRVDVRLGDSTYRVRHSAANDDLLPVPERRHVPGEQSLAEAGVAADTQIARFTYLRGRQDDGEQRVVNPAYDQAIPLGSSFKDAVSAARDLADRNSTNGNWNQESVALLRRPDDQLVGIPVPDGWLKTERLMGDSANVSHIFVDEVNPALEAIVSSRTWVDLRSDRPGEVHTPERLTILPFLGPV